MLNVFEWLETWICVETVKGLWNLLVFNKYISMVGDLNMYKLCIECVGNMKRPWNVSKYDKCSCMVRNLRMHGLYIKCVGNIRRLWYMWKYVGIWRNWCM